MIWMENSYDESLLLVRRNAENIICFGEIKLFVKKWIMSDILKSFDDYLYSKLKLIENDVYFGVTKSFENELIIFLILTQKNADESHSSMQK